MGFSGAGMEEEYYGSRDVLEGVFGGANTIQKMMDVEAALAWAECEAGLVPEQYAGEIQEKCSVKLLDEAVYAEARRTTGHPLMGMLRAYKAICSKEAGEYLHYGATTQDISDTALILQLREAWDIVEDKTRRLREILSGKAREYRSLVMIGRTNDQQAMPITLGFKISTWIDELDRCLERMEQGRERIFVGQFAGAVGTMASLEQEGPRVQKLLLERLGLAAPKISWFATRDRLAEFTFDLAMICGAVGRMGNEVYNEQRSEVNELAEGYALGKVGSSTMPHKRNPFLPGRLAGRGRIAGTLVMRAMQCLENTNERDCRTLCIEPYHLKEICCLVDGTLDIALELFGQMEVHEDQIRYNLEILQGLIYSEALMMRLAETYGRMEAHELVYELAMAAIGQKRQLKELALADSRVTAHLTEEELENLMRPEHYTGLAEHFVDQVVGTE